MSTRYYSDLVRGQDPSGRPVTQDALQDALRALSDTYTRYIQLGDEDGQALAAGMMAALLITRGQKAPKLTMRRGVVALPQAPPY